MSGLAMICQNLGYDVYGSDREQSNMTDMLQKKGIKVYIGHKKEHIKDDIDTLVYTAAIPKDNEEYIAAQNMNIHMMERSVFLGKLMEKYENSIAIAGTHGKTTTTSMTTLIFNEMNEKPTALIGGNFSNIGGNLEIGTSNFFITEACEYVDSFLQFYPKIAVITNIEEDHLDYFKDLKQIKNSFLKFSNQVKKDGYVIANGDDENVRDALKDSKSTVLYYGFDKTNDFIIENLKFDEEGYPTFDLYYKKNSVCIGTYTLSVFGKHNVYNATSSIICAYLCDIENKKIISAIKKFKGVGRRFEYIGEKNGVKVYDDYAHHPTEIKSTLNAIKTLNKKKLYSVFQPHTYTRTKTLFNEFVSCFDDTDVIIFADIYAAREPFDNTISSKMLCDKVSNRVKEAYYFDSFESIVDFLEKNCTKQDLIFTIGAGDVYKIGKMYLNK